MAATNDDRTRLTSLFVNGEFPRRRLLIAVLALLGGFLLTYSWSAHFVDQTIGFTVADALLDRDAHNTPIGSLASGVLFAFVTGLAGTFTACNIAVFGAVGPMLGRRGGAVGALGGAWRPLAWLAVGMVPISALYGAIVGVVGTRMPQFSTVRTPGLSPRTIEAMVTFGLVGLSMLVLGLSALGLIRDPFARISRRFPQAPLVFVGVLIGAFLIGRPYPLFRDMFRHAAESHNPFYGAAAFTLQSVGNIAVMAVVFLIISALLGRRIQGWFARRPARASALIATAFIVAGAFTLLYWDVRLLGRLGYIWFPTAPWV